MTFTTKITVGTALAVAAVVSSAVPAATSAQPRAAAEMREVCAQSVYVKQAPGVIPVGSVRRGEEVEVTRYSTSGRFAHIVAHRPMYTTRGWVPRRYLCAKGKRAEFAKTSRYSVRIVNSPAGGDPGFLYVGGPANVTVIDRERAGQTLKLCVTPAPVERSSCRSGRAGRTIDSVAWSEAVPTEVRIEIDGGPVLVDTVHPYAVPVIGDSR
ncbi:MAG TPA: hypothetical protein VNA28_14460 [Solirubrobacteraceae bacterium]|nr:hypothetical protein [Solirubrobacteraceae bacterium]